MRTGPLGQSELKDPSGPRFAHQTLLRKVWWAHDGMDFVHAQSIQWLRHCMPGLCGQSVLFPYFTYEIATQQQSVSKNRKYYLLILGAWATVRVHNLTAGEGPGTINTGFYLEKVTWSSVELSKSNFVKLLVIRARPLKSGLMTTSIGPWMLSLGH